MPSAQTGSIFSTHPTCSTLGMNHTNYLPEEQDPTADGNVTDKVDQRVQHLAYHVILPTPAIDQLKVNLLQYLKKERISQSELARRTGIQARAISRLVSDAAVRHSPTLETLEAVAAGLGLTVPELLSPDFVAEAPHTPKHVQEPECLPRQLAQLIEDFMHCGQAKRKELLVVASRLAEGDSGTDAQSSVPPPKFALPPKAVPAPKVSPPPYFPPFNPPRSVARL